MAETAPQIRYRYPGIRSFERAEAGQFFGRSREIAELLNLVKIKPLTVLFAKSGIGKTSLLNAGLSPLLEANGYLPVKIRLQDRELAPVDTVKKVLEPFLDTRLLEKYGGAEPSLWEYLRACTFISAGQSLIPVLLFDQFEELFTHAPKDQEALTRSLADLIHERLPDRVQENFRRFPRTERSDELLDWFSPVRLRVVFAIRTDRMGELDRLKRHIPTVLHDRYYLQPMQYEAAREAIVQPATLPAPSGEMADLQAFQTPPFAYSAAALDVMLSALGNENGEVESFQLQLLCRHIENRVGQLKIRTVDPGTFGGPDGVSTVLNDYYEREIGLLEPGEQIIARRFIEEGLIDHGRRVGIPAGAEETRFQVTPALLDKLLDSRLIRAEVIHLGKIYELSHDTLVEPVMRSYEQRQVEEERRRANEALAEERARLAELAKKRRRARMFAISGFTLAALALVGGFFAWRNARAAERARRSADVSALAAKAWSVYRDDHTLAFRIAQAALAQDSTNTDARQTLVNILNIPTTTFYQAVFSGHDFEVTALDFSPDSRLVASGSYDHSVQIWDRENGQALTRLSEEQGGHFATVSDVRFAPDGQTVFSAGEDGRVLQTDLNGQLVHEFEAGKSVIRSMDLSPDGRWLATGGNDAKAALWSTDGRSMRTFSGHAGTIRAVEFNAKGTLLLTGSEDGTARLWNTGNGAGVHVFNLGDVKVNAVAFAPSGQLVLLGCSDRTARLFTLSGQPVVTISGHTAEVVKVAFSPDGKYLFTASSDFSAKMWSVAGEELLKLAGHTERLSSLAVSPDGNWVVTGSFDFLAKVWNLPFNLKKATSQHAGPVLKIAVSPDGRTIISGSEDNSAKLWSADGTLLHNLTGHRGWVNTVAASPDGRHFLTGAADKKVMLWSADGRLQQSIDVFKANIFDVAYSPDGKQIAVASGNAIWLLDSSGSVLRMWEGHTGDVRSVEFAPNGRSVLSAGAEGSARIWSLDGKLTDSVMHEGVKLFDAKFSADGDKIITAGRELPVRIWNRKGELLKTLYGHLDEIYHIAISPDGQHFATSSWDKTARIWNMAGEQLFALPHPDGVYGAVFLPDGKRLATACRDKLVRVWDTQSGQLLYIAGGQLNPGIYLNDARIAPLSDIPFSLKSYYGISLETAFQICGTDTRHLIGMGTRYLTLAGTHEYDYALGLSDIHTAELFFQKAQQFDNGTRKNEIDSLLAETYSKRANHNIVNLHVAEYLQAAETGLRYQQLPILRVYVALGRLMQTNSPEARQQALNLSRDTLTPLDDYLNLREVIWSEADFYKNQLGIESPGLDSLLKELE